MNESAFSPFPPEARFDDVPLIEEALRECAPDAEPIAPLTLLGTGFFSVAVETAGGTVFRLACTREVVPRYAKEATLLPWLSERLPVRIPVPRWHIGPNDRLPYGAIGYPKIEGRRLSRADLHRPDRAGIAQQLATFTHALHAVPQAQAQAHGAPAPGLAGFEHTRDKALAILKSRLSAHEFVSVTRWWTQMIEEASAWQFEPVLTHCDIGADNILVDDAGGQIVAVLDWEHASIGDPAFDFRTLGRLGNELQRTVLSAYQQLGGQLGADLDRRLNRYWALGPFYGIELATRRKLESLFAENIARLRERGVL